MTTWTSNELNKIGTAEELQIASLRAGRLRGVSIVSRELIAILCRQNNISAIRRAA